MTRFTTKTLCSIFGLGLACLCVADANACPRSGGSYYRSAPSRSYSYSQPSYHTTYSQPSYSQSSYSQPVIQNSFAISSSPVGQPGFPQNGPQDSPSQIQQVQPIQQGQPGQQSFGQAPQQQPAPQQQVAQQQSPQQSALQMLANFGGEATQPTSTPVAPQGFNGVGTWKATLSNDAVVTLQMGADGNFVWTALSNGKQSTFQGTYTLTNNSLSLSRSTDSQKLDGSITVNGESFIFSIAGSSDAGLTFSRS